jgi:hypothetical protein
LTLVFFVNQRPFGRDSWSEAVSYIVLISPVCLMKTKFRDFRDDPTEINGFRGAIDTEEISSTN